MAWSIVNQDPESGLYLWSNGSEQKWGGQDGTYWDANGNRQNIHALEPTNAGWSVTNSVDNGEAGYTAPTFTNGNLSLAFNPATGPTDKNSALEALYLPYVNGDTAKMNEIIAASPDAYAGFGITPQNAGQLVDSTFYDRVHNISNNDWIDTLGQGALGALYGAAIGDFAGLFSMDNAMGNLFGGQSGPIAGGASPTHVAGWSTEAPTFSGSFDPTLPTPPTFSGTFNPALPPTFSGTFNPALPGATGGVSASSLGGTAASAAASALGGSGGSGGSNTGALGGVAGAGSALSRILDGTATSADWLSLGGTAGSTLLGLYGSQQQTNALKDLAQKYMDFGAPSRARYEAAMSPGFDITSIPGYQGALDSTSESLLRKLSATGGNPYGNPGGLIEANKAIVSGTALPALNEYARLNANTGFGSSMNAAIPLQTGAINSEANGLNAIGSGLASLTTPKNSLQDLLKQMQGLNQGTSLV